MRSRGAGSKLRLRQKLKVQSMLVPVANDSFLDQPLKDANKIPLTCKETPSLQFAGGDKVEVRY